MALTERHRTIMSVCSEVSKRLGDRPVTAQPWPSAPIVSGWAFRLEDDERGFFIGIRSLDTEPVEALADAIESQMLAQGIERAVPEVEPDSNDGVEAS